jgi:hypothetical protein
VGPLGPQLPRDAETCAGRRAHVHDRHVWAQGGGGRDRLITGGHVGDHIYSVGAQQCPARGPGDLVIIDDHDPGRPGTVGAISSACWHASTIAAGATGRIGDVASLRWRVAISRLIEPR